MANRYRIIALTILIPVLFAGHSVRSVHAQSHDVTFDGIYWETLTPIEKVSLMEGYVYGRESGFEAARFLAATSLDDIPGVKGPRLDKAFATKDINGGGGFTFGQLTSGIDECYKDFRNKKLTIDDCYVWTVWGIKGIPDATRENYLEYMRKQYTTN